MKQIKRHFRTLLSYSLATMSGLCLIGGAAILSGKR